MPAKQKKSSRLNRVSKKAKNTKPHFKIWVGVLVVLIVAVAGVVVVRLSEASNGYAWYNSANRSTVLPLRTNTNSSLLKLNYPLPTGQAPFYVQVKTVDTNYQKVLSGNSPRFLIGDGTPGTGSVAFSNNMRNAKKVCVHGLSIGYTDLELHVESRDSTYSGPKATASQPPFQINNGVAKTSDGKAKNDLELICASTPVTTYPGSFRSTLPGQSVDVQGRNGAVVLRNNTRNGYGYVFITNMVFYYP